MNTTLKEELLNLNNEFQHERQKKIVEVMERVEKDLKLRARLGKTKIEYKIHPSPDHEDRHVLHDLCCKSMVRDFETLWENKHDVNCGIEFLHHSNCQCDDNVLTCPFIVRFSW